MPDPIVVMDDGAVRIIRINRPEKKNALTLAMYVEMTRALREAEASDAIRCVIFAGAPGSFCAGNDIADFLKAADSGLDPRALKFLNALRAAKSRWSPQSAALPSASGRPCCSTSIMSSPVRCSQRRS
jgi:enoyl-CoA hydratase/carnithine racemase